MLRYIIYLMMIFLTCLWLSISLPITCWLRTRSVINNIPISPLHNSYIIIMQQLHYQCILVTTLPIDCISISLRIISWKITSFLISILKEISIKRLYKTLIRISRSKYIWSNKYLKYVRYFQERTKSKWISRCLRRHVDEI